MGSGRGCGRWNGAREAAGWGGYSVGSVHQVESFFSTASLAPFSGVALVKELAHVQGYPLQSMRLTEEIGDSISLSPQGLLLCSPPPPLDSALAFLALLHQWGGGAGMSKRTGLGH